MIKTVLNAALLFTWIAPALAGVSSSTRACSDCLPIPPKHTYPLSPNITHHHLNAIAKAICLKTANQLRATLGIPPLTQSTELENNADAATLYDQSHGGDSAIHSHALLTNVGENEYQEYPASDPSVAAKRAIYDWWHEGPSPEGRFDEEHGHYMNLIDESYTRAGCGFGFSHGWIYVYINFK